MAVGQKWAIVQGVDSQYGIEQSLCENVTSCSKTLHKVENKTSMKNGIHQRE